MNQLHQLLKEQARAYICGKLDHSWKFILPVEKRDERRQVHVRCSACELEAWMELPEEGYRRFLKDMKDGKIN